MTEIKKDSLIKIRCCAVMQYFDYYDVSEIAVIESRIKSLTNIKKYAIVIHDKDLLDSWEPKKRHFHAVLTFSNATTIWAVANWLHIETQYVEKIRTTTKSAMLYLVHRNDPDKYQYSPESVSANFDYIEYVDGIEPMQRRENIAQKIAKWEIKQYNLYEYITVDEFARNRNYYNNCFYFRQCKMKTQDRNLECIFITWASGTWKTTLAKDLVRWKHCYISSGGKNPLDNYAWEECIILDDIRPETYEYNDLLKLTDNHTDSLVGCRFYNKSIAECKTIIVTSILPIEDFTKKWSENEDPKQLLRRFKLMIIVDKDNYTYYAYNDDTWRHELVDCWPNKVSQRFENNTLTNKDYAYRVANMIDAQ